MFLVWLVFHVVFNFVFDCYLLLLLLLLFGFLFALSLLHAIVLSVQIPPVRLAQLVACLALKTYILQPQKGGLCLLD